MVSIATSPSSPSGGRRDTGFFVGGAIAMALVIVTGFSVHLAMGRSSFAAPPLVHAHAIVFMGWMVIYVLQNVLVATDQLALHRRLGWLAAAWMIPMLVLGVAVTVALVRKGMVPFFFRPQQFLVFDPMVLLTFVGLTVAAIVMRRQTDWHRRLHFCGMALLIGPGVGRLLPMPFLPPWAWEATVAVCLLFPLVGMAADLRRSGRVHPAWLWGVGAMLASVALTEAITYGPAGGALYAAVTAGSPGAAVAPLDFPPPPGPPPGPPPAGV